MLSFFLIFSLSFSLLFTPYHSCGDWQRDNRALRLFDVYIRGRLGYYRDRFRVYLENNEEGTMPTCHDMELGQVYVCEGCGLELKVVQECEECGIDAEACGCEEPCVFECCGEPLKLKQEA